MSEHLLVVFHVFRGRAKLWTRCGERVRGYTGIVARAEARNAEHWRPGMRYYGGAICVGCAHRMGPSGPPPS